MDKTYFPSGMTNRNILGFLIASPFSSIGQGLTWFTIAFLVAAFSQNNKNTQLGRIGGIVAIVTIVSSFIGSYVSDKIRRDIMIIIGTIVGITGFYLLTIATNINGILFAQSIISLSWGLMGPAQNAIIADSTKKEERNIIYAWMFVTNNVFSAIGNIIGYFIYKNMGTNLDVDLLRKAIKISFYLIIIAGLIIIFVVRDKYSLPKSQDKVMGEEQDEKTIGGFTKTGIRAVTIMLFSSMLISFGAGFSIPFMQFFFVDIYGISLSNLSILFAIMIAFTGILGMWVAHLGNKHGRVKLIVMSQMVSVILLYTLATYPPLYLAIIALLTRNAAMNAVGPLVQALLMDHTPRTRRSLINFINSLSWTFLNGAGQFIGGMLIDRFGYWIGFVITATFYLFANILISFIREEKKKN